LIRQCDAFSNPSERASPNVPFVMVLQADRVAHTSTVVVAPLVKADRLRADQGLYPIFVINGLRVALAITEMATVPRGALKVLACNLSDDRYRVIRAIDELFTGA